jgi:lipid II:glycine glycyltransferase (peptidoglycan interpeptide bridge formation enzyme)
MDNHFKNIFIRQGKTFSNYEWDQFLEKSPNGHFEQSSGWASAKLTEGWKCYRIEFINQDKLCAGFQVLYKRLGFFKIGYISRGPVIDHSNRELIDLVFQVMKSEAVKHHLSAFIVHPPNEAHWIYQDLLEREFLPNKLHSVTKATLLVDTYDGIERIFKQMRSSTRHKIRQGIKRNVRVYEGTQRELAVFFQLMRNTCKRQKTRSVPRKKRFLQSMWSSMHSSGHMRLTFAEINGMKVAGLISVPFGRRVTFWKKGWNDTQSALHPNDVLFYEALEWSCKNGYNVCDFASLEEDIANAIINNQPISDVHAKSRHFFNLGFGGKPFIYPQSCIWFKNPFIKDRYRCYYKA